MDAVTIGRFNSEFQASLAMSRLAEEGISACLVDQELMMIGHEDWVGVQVRPADAKRACALLGQVPPKLPDTPACARRAFRTAVLGVAIPPFTLYSMWAIWSLRHRLVRHDDTDRRVLIWAATINLAAVVMQAFLVVAVVNPGFFG